MSELYAEYAAKGWPSIDPRSPDYCYRPCVRGVHVCGEHPDGDNCLTVLNLPCATKAQARALFDRAKAECACDAGEPADLIVDLCEGGDIVEDFPMTRQMVARLRALGGISR